MTDMDNLEFLESPHSTPTQAEEDYQWNRSDIAVAEATKKDCVIVRPRSNELFIDIDNESQLNSFSKAIEVFEKTHPCDFVMKPSSSGKTSSLSCRRDTEERNSRRKNAHSLPSRFGK
jgi:hypothetical protein